MVQAVSWSARVTGGPHQEPGAETKGGDARIEPGTETEGGGGTHTNLGTETEDGGMCIEPEVETQVGSTHIEYPPFHFLSLADSRQFVLEQNVYICVSCYGLAFCSGPHATSFLEHCDPDCWEDFQCVCFRNLNPPTDTWRYRRLPMSQDETVES